MNAGSSIERVQAEFRRQLPGILPRLSRFAMALTRARSEADDLLQAACERALSRIDQWNPNTRLDSWMFRIVQTIWWNELRSRKVREKHLAHEQVEHPKLQPDDADGQLLLVRAEQEIFRLPENLRVVLLLVCVEQLSYREAAEAASIPIGTVMSRLARAHLLLMQRLGLNDEVKTRGNGNGASADSRSDSHADLVSREPVRMDGLSRPSNERTTPRAAKGADRDPNAMNRSPRGER